MISAPAGLAASPATASSIAASEPRTTFDQQAYLESVNHDLPRGSSLPERLSLEGGGNAVMSVTQMFDPAIPCRGGAYSGGVLGGSRTSSRTDAGLSTCT